MTDKSKSTLRNIQALRAIAALMVIFVHLDGLLRLSGGASFGSGGVDIFFVISGFIMVAITVDGGRSPLSFLVERLARIAPLYWILTLGVFALALAAPSLLAGTKADFVQLLKSLAFVPYERGDGTVRPVLFVGWTLNYEMFFYGLFALGLVLPSRRLGIFAVVAALVVLVVLGLGVGPERPLVYFYTRPAVLEFAAGMLLGLYAGRLPVLAGPLAKGLVLGLALLMAAAVVAGPFVTPNMANAVVCGPAALVLVAAALVLERSGWTVSFRPVLLMGDASYALYLTHPFVVQAATKAAQKLHAESLAPIAILVAVFSCCACAVATHRLIEVPILKLTRRWTTRSAPRHLSSAIRDLKPGLSRGG
ncbi:MAG: acyltransferase [Caulobacter sp.]|nr:acyltransferase [Caulobacter sp.]